MDFRGVSDELQKEVVQVFWIWHASEIKTYGSQTLMVESQDAEINTSDQV